MKAQIKQGQFEIEGDARFTKTAIVVKTREFGELKFKLENGKAIGGVAKLKNYGELMNAHTANADASPVVYILMLNKAWHDPGISILTVRQTRRLTKVFSGVIESIEQFSGYCRKNIGDVIELKPASWRSAGASMRDIYERREEAVKVIANRVVNEAKEFLTHVDRWKDGFDKPEHLKLTVAEVKAAIAEEGDDDDVPGISEMLLDLLIDFKVPGIIMTDPPKPTRKK